MEDKVIPELVGTALTLMKKEYAHFSGVEELAQRLSVSKEHLVRSFRAATSETPGHCLTRIRLENACRYLQSRDYSVELVAGLCGFACGNYFCKVFRRAYGMTPLEYRALNWNENTEPPENERSTFV